MARKRKYPKITVTARSVPSRALVTLGPGHPVWTDGAVSVPSGALVRVLPPHDATDAAVDRLTTSVGKCAAAVRPAPRAAAPVVVGAPATEANALLNRVGRDYRAVVMQVADDSFADDKGSLKLKIEEWLSKAEQ